ncbi:DoxX family membrane protein [Rhodanobacter sp. OK091]|uniref:DoxX family membrane protein n=1 Tax=Rhodanobacter sp. OK091 TaxID=1881037 RepID=UPI00091DDEDA|nr:DoxX family membrane protein [Rhodanobacter sp. OK091]SHM42199.1 DoxX protein [Rhodanobacter sp. OK091]
MGSATRLGSGLFGIGMLAFGVLNFVFGTPVLGLEPLPDWLPAQTLWTYIIALLLVVGGVCVLSDRLRPRQSAIMLGGLLSLWLILQVPTLLANIHNGSKWTSAFECLALCSAAWVLAHALSDSATVRTSWNGRLRRLADIGRYGFGITLPVFGALHFIYWQYVASVIPGWIPGSPVFWAYFTGCAHIAAGLAILSGVQARLAATMLGIMFGSWVLIVHVPRVLASPHNQSEWTSLCVAIALCGGAWLMAGYLARSSVTVDTSQDHRPQREPASA